MSEKRYSLVYYADKGGAFIKNNETGTEWYHDSRASLLEIVNELNGLAEENKDLEEARSYYQENFLTMKTERHQLKEENEQLKQQNRELQGELQDKEVGLNLWNAENTILEEDKKQLQKENEELKTFKDKVFALIDARIEIYKHKPFMAPVSAPMSVNFDEDTDRLARLSELEQLKEELSE